jgi:hypothetical protein
VSVGFQHCFTVTQSNRVFSWVPQTQAVALSLEDQSKVIVEEVKGLKPGCIITDMKSASFQTILLLSDKTVLKIDHPLLNNGDSNPL